MQRGDTVSGDLFIDRSAFLLTMGTGNDGNVIRLMQSLHGESRQLAAAQFEGDTVFLKITGVYLGLYATSKGAPTQNYADFDFFTYEPTAISPDDGFRRQASDENIH